MADLQTVCSMCGDIGFPDKLFRCTNCHNRFQHSYCSNYYNESAEPIKVCDWCKSEQKRSSTIRNGSSSSNNWCKSEQKRSSTIRDGSSSNKSMAGKETTFISNRSKYSGDKIKQHDREERSEKGKSPNGTPSPRQTTRRYKLLKDVMS